MLLVASEHTLDAAEPALRRAAHRYGVATLGVREIGRTGEDGALVFPLDAPELYGALLAADLRMAAFLPCRIAAYADSGRVIFAAVSPLDFCRLLNRNDLTPLAGPLDALLRGVMEEAARSAPATARAGAAAHSGGLGATEEQVDMRGPIPQRIDRRGTKIEELGGTGEHDAQGG